jgi:hypothetical protein
MHRNEVEIVMEMKMSYLQVVRHRIPLRKELKHDLFAVKCFTTGRKLAHFSPVGRIDCSG